MRDNNSSTNSAPRARGRNPVIDPVLLAKPFEQAGVAQEFQVPRNARLALAEDLGQFDDGELASAQRCQHSQAGGFGRRPELSHDRIE